MAIDPDTLLNWKFEDVHQDYVQRDAILYALGLGLGQDPLSELELSYVYEKDLQVVPTFAVTLATLGLWVKDPALKITLEKLVHSAQKATFFKPLPAKANIVGHACISEVFDRGAEKGAVITVERNIHDANTQELYCTLEQTLMLRADGGFDGESPPTNPIIIPDTSPIKRLGYQTTPGQAIIYRLSGDWNPLHIDPDIARRAGFTQPILHGYCSYGIAGWVACLATEQDCSQLKSLQCQFTGPVIPGDELIFDFWQSETGQWLFQAKVNGKIVLNRGCAEFSE